MILNNSILELFNIGVIESNVSRNLGENSYSALAQLRARTPDAEETEAPFRRAVQTYRSNLRK